MTGSFEAKKHAYRQTQDGIVLSFVVHPNDMSSALAIAPLGTRYMVAFSEIGDDEGPVAQRSEPGTLTPVSESVVERVPDAGSSPAGAVHAKDRRPFSSLPLSQQSALRCGDKAFQEFLRVEWGSELSKHNNDFAETVRVICGAKTSRKEFDIPDSMAAMGWKVLEEEYQSCLTDQRYAGAIR